MNNTNLIDTAAGIFKNYPQAYFGLIIALAIYILILRKSDKITRISFIFIFVTILSFIWLAGYERYLYLPSIGFCIILVHFIFHVSRSKSFVVLLLSTFIFYNLYCLYSKKNNWEIASEISRNTVENIVSLTKDLPSGSVVYFNNIPAEYNGAWIIRFEVHLFPELFLKRNDISFYYLYEKSADKNNNNNNVYLYEYNNRSLVKE
jgi:hypothetical protein